MAVSWTEILRFGHRGREREPIRELFRCHLFGQGFVQLEDEAAAIGAIALRVQTDDVEGLDGADLDFLACR